jgi:hypothetical protein
MVFSFLHLMVKYYISIMAHCDAELEGGGDHYINLPVLHQGYFDGFKITLEHYKGAAK